jgi:hypothetical protein
MVRSEVYRARKFEGKMDPDAVRSRIAALKEDMVEQTLQRQSELVGLEKDIKGIVEPQGVPTILIPQYLNVGRQLWSLSGRFRGATFQSEAQLLAQKWVGRGLDKDIVNLILGHFGVSPLP